MSWRRTGWCRLEGSRVWWRRCRRRPRSRRRWVRAVVVHDPDRARARSWCGSRRWSPGSLRSRSSTRSVVRTVGRGAALVAATLTTLSPFMIFYSAEARGYGVLMALLLLSTLTLLIAVDDGRARWWVAYGVCVCLAAYTHYTAVFVLAAQLGWAFWVHPRARRPLLLSTALAALVVRPLAAEPQGRHGLTHHRHPQRPLADRPRIDPDHAGPVEHRVPGRQHRRPAVVSGFRVVAARPARDRRRWCC